jgi:septal ring factor EnvC (AmiA/AmiB activator)
MRRSKKIQTAAIGMLCLTTLTTGACVTQRTYDTAAADLEAVKTELRSASTETQELTQQVNDLQQLQIGLARQREVALSMLKQARKAMKAERTVSQTRLKKLNLTIQHLSTQQKNLRYAVKHSAEEQASLQSAVEYHTSKLGEADELSTSSAPAPAQTALVPPVQTLVPNESVPKPTVNTTAAPVNQPAANPKPQSAGNQLPEPAEEDWLSFFKNWITSFWQSIFF